MTRWFTLRRLISIAVLVGVWLALWGDISVANLLSGVVIAVAVSATGIGTAGRGGVRILPLLKFSVLVFWDLLGSTWTVAREVITPTDYTDEAIIAVDVPIASRSHLLLLIVSITLTPGTAVVDADPDSGTLYLHLLHAERREETAAHVRELAELACAALPIDETNLRLGSLR